MFCRTLSLKPAPLGPRSVAQHRLWQSCSEGAQCVSPCERTFGRNSVQGEQNVLGWEGESLCRASGDSGLRGCSRARQRLSWWLCGEDTFSKVPFLLFVYLFLSFRACWLFSGEGNVFSAFLHCSGQVTEGHVVCRAVSVPVAVVSLPARPPSQTFSVPHRVPSRCRAPGDLCSQSAPGKAGTEALSVGPDHSPECQP